MTSIDRRSFLYAFGLASVARASPRLTAASGTVTVAMPGENRFGFAASSQAAQSPCKVTSADSGHAVTIFEMNALPRAGPFLHVHHREDEWYYVLDGNFLFKAGKGEYALTAGSSIWLPRGVPMVSGSRPDSRPMASAAPLTSPSPLDSARAKTSSTS